MYYIIYVDDADINLSAYVGPVSQLLIEITENQVKLEPCTRVRLATAKPVVDTIFDTNQAKGNILAGLIVDIKDAEFEVDGGVRLLRDLRKDARYARPYCKIALVTTTGNQDARKIPEADAVISRLQARGGLGAVAIHLAEIFEIEHLVNPQRKERILRLSREL